MLYQKLFDLKLIAYFQYPALYCWWRIPMYIDPYPSPRTVAIKAPTWNLLYGGSNTFYMPYLCTDTDLGIYIQACIYIENERGKEEW